MLTREHVKKMNTINEAKRRAADTYNSASDHFDDRPLGFWDRYGTKTVRRLSLKTGMRILDVACGTGASAIPAAREVGKSGAVTGIDLSENQLRLASRKAEYLGLNNIEFKRGDMENVGYPDKFFDSVICVFGIFFVPDMEKLVNELWRMVKTGGKLAVTTWGSDFFEPVYGQWKNEIKKVRPDLYIAYNPWDRISTPEQLYTLMEMGGTSNIEVEEESGFQSLTDENDWWTIAMGSGLRWTIDMMGPDTAERVRQANLEWIRKKNIKNIKTNVIYAVAVKDR